MISARPASLLVLLLVLTLAGCSRTSEVPAAAPAPPKPTPATSAVTPLPAAPGAPWKIALALDPDPPHFVKPAGLRVTLTDPAGKPVAGAQVKASLVMKLMDMGKNEVTLADKGKGSYEGSGSFSMSGPWDVVVTASLGGKSAEQKFEVKVAD